MKKSKRFYSFISVMLMTIMLISALSVTGFAAPTSDEAILTTETTSTAHNDELEVDVKEQSDFSLRVSTRPNLLAYVHHTTPDLKLIFTDVVTGKTTEVALNKDNFISKSESFKLPIDFASEDAESKFVVSMKTDDPFLTGLCDDTLVNGTATKNTCRANGDGMEVTITKNGLDLAVFCDRTSEYIVNTIDSEGNKIPNITLRILNSATKAYKEVTSDENGRVILNTDEIDGALLFVCLTEGYKIAEGNGVMSYAVEESAVKSTIPVIDIKLNKTEIANSNIKTGYNIVIASNSMLLFNPTDMIVTLSNDTDEFSFNKLGIGTNSVDLPQGNYKVAVETNGAFDVKHSDSASTDSELKIDVTAKATLKISNSKEDCKFNIANISGYEDKDFEGAKDFGVLTGQTVMVRNLLNDTTYTVSIDKEGITELDLATGVISATQTSTKGDVKTADYITWVIIFIVLALIVLITLLVIYLKKNNHLKGKKTHTQLLSLILVGVMVMSFASGQITVFAGAGSAPPRESIPGGSRGTTGNLQAFNNTGAGWSTMIKITLVPNMGMELLTEDAEEWQLAQRDKFRYQETELYLTTDTKTYNRWMNGGDIITIFDDVNGVTGGGVSLGRVWWRGDVVNEAERNARTLPIARSAESMEGWDNEFIKFILPFFHNRDLSKEYGSALNAYMYEHLNINNQNPDKQDYTQKVFDDYIRYLQETVGVSDIAVQKYKDAFKDGKLSILFQSMIGCYIMDGNQGTAYYITTHDAMEVLHYTGKIAFPSREVEIVRNNYNAVSRSGLGCSGSDNNAHCIEFGHLPFSIAKSLIENYLRTLKPAADCLPAGDANPFGGWGFFNLGEGEERILYPSIYGDIIYKIYDNSGNPIDTKVVEVDDYAVADRDDHYILDIVDNTPDMNIPNTVTIGDTTYVADLEQTVPVTAVINNSEMLKVADLDPSMITTVAKNTSGWSYPVLSLFPYVPELLNKLTHEGGTPDDIKFTFEVVVRPVPQPANGEDRVPQWRINKYWSSIIPMFPTGTEKASSILSLNELTADVGHAESSLSSDNGTAMRLISPLLNNVPFISNAKTDVNVNKIAVKHAKTPKTAITMYGDLMAFKENGNVDNLTTAAWVNQASTQYGDFIIDRSEGSDRVFGDEYVKKSAVLDYSFEPIHMIKHYRGIKRGHTRFTGCCCTTVTDDTTYTTTPATYSLSVLFNCFNQPARASQSFTDTRNETDGFTEFTQQSPKTMRLYAEVPMLFTDVAHNNSIRFVTADRATEVQPISYHTLQYSTKIVPTISGIAATDSKAKAKLAEMGLVDPDFEAQMLNKGSATTTSYDVQGKLTAKTYALDINQSRYKNAWKSNDYTAQGVNDEFLAGFASAQPDGSYTANIDMTENLKINNQSYGNVKNTVTVKANNVNVKEYKLIVRAGEITSIEGHTDWQTRYPELADVLLNKMKANHAGVFSVFNSGDGDVLDEPEFARLAGMLREDSPSIAEGKGWYSEDTTLISLYEYTTDFALVGSQYSNKIPSSIAGLESPQNKQLFYNTAYEGHLTLDFDLQAVDARCKTPLHYETSSDKWSNKVYKLYAVPNVSVQDTTN